MVHNGLHGHVGSFPAACLGQRRADERNTLYFPVTTQHQPGYRSVCSLADKDWQTAPMRLVKGFFWAAWIEWDTVLRELVGLRPVFFRQGKGGEQVQAEQRQ